MEGADTTKQESIREKRLRALLLANRGRKVAQLLKRKRASEVMEIDLSDVINTVEASKILNLTPEYTTRKAVSIGLKTAKIAHARFFSRKEVETLREAELQAIEELERSEQTDG